MSALDQTMNAAASIFVRTATAIRKIRLSANVDMVPAKQVREEFAALHELVSGAAEMIALARSGGSADDAEHQEMHQ